MITFKAETRSPDWNIGLTFYNCIFVESCIHDKGLWNSHDMIGVEALPTPARCWDIVKFCLALSLSHKWREICFKNKQVKIPLFLKPILTRIHSHPVWNFLCELRTLQLIFAKFVSVNTRKITKYPNNHYCSGLAEQNQKTVKADKWSANDEDALCYQCMINIFVSPWVIVGLPDYEKVSLGPLVRTLTPPPDLVIENLSRLLWYQWWTLNSHQRVRDRGISRYLVSEEWGEQEQ